MTVEIVNTCDFLHELRPEALICIIDLETTGLDADDEIVEVGAVDLNVRTGDVSDRTSQIVPTRQTYPPCSLALFITSLTTMS